MKTTKEEIAEAYKLLRKWLKPGATVYTVLRHVSASGLTRRIDLYTIRKGELVYLSGYAGLILKISRHPSKEGLTVGGSGMDMGFHLVYSLSRALYPKGFIPAKAGKNHGRNGAPASQLDNDGGYALNHHWL